MQIWKLQAIDPDDPSWKPQDFKGPFIVRAENEDRARRKVFQRTAQLVVAPRLRDDIWFPLDQGR